MRESARAKELARSPRQRKYLDGGRRPSSRYDQSFPSETSFRNRDRSEQTATAMSRATQRYAKTKSNSYVPPASDKPNRAARRFAIYGPGDTPPRRTRDSGRDPGKHSSRISAHGEFQTPTPRSALRKRAERDPDKHTRRSSSDGDYRTSTPWSAVREPAERDPDKHTRRSSSDGDYRTSTPWSAVREPAERDPDKHTRRSSSDGDYRTSTPWSARRERADMSERSVTAADMYRGQDHSEEVASEERSSYARKSRANEWSERESDVPVAIPYTTPASEFLYGTSVVSAALKYSRRKFYKLYCYGAPDRVNIGQDTAMRSLASSQGVEVMHVQGQWLRIMDKMSTGRPHNVSGLLKPTCNHLSH